MTALRAAFQAQAKSSIELGSPFMGRLMTILAQHWPNDTAVARRFAQWEGDIGSSGAALPLRLASGLHALAISGDDASLAAAYPPNEVEDDALMAAVLGAIRTHDTFLYRWIENAPQTNEVGRSAVLIAVAHWLEAKFHLPICLSELGASAGLNLQFDKFALHIGGECWGDTASPVRLQPDWRGQLPPRSNPHIVEREGVDLSPLHIGVPEDELRLLSYIWPDQAERISRLRAAIGLSIDRVERGDAVDWLERRLTSLRPNALHLIYHTVAWQYFPPERQARGRAVIEAAGTAASHDTPIAWFSMEADGKPDGAALTLRLWPGGAVHSLGRSGFHGQWVDWRPG